MNYVVVGLIHKISKPTCIEYEPTGSYYFQLISLFYIIQFVNLTEAFDLTSQEWHQYFMVIIHNMYKRWVWVAQNKLREGHGQKWLLKKGNDSMFSPQSTNDRCYFMHRPSYCTWHRRFLWISGSLGIKKQSGIMKVKLTLIESQMAN